MDEFIKIRHSFNAGDLITVLPGLRQLCRNTGKKVKIFQRLNLPAFYYDKQVNATIYEGESVCMNDRLFLMIKPLIEAQNYIESFEIWEGQEVHLDYDLTRDTKSIPMPAALIHTWGEALFPETSTDLSEDWINVDYKLERTYANKVLINRTQRYNNPYQSYYFLKPYESQFLFSGTEIEHKEFCSKNNLEIELLVVKDFYELAQIINQCRFGVYSQSLHWHIADAMKTKRVLEICAPFPNTFATGANGYHSFGQKSMEYFVNKLINQ